MPTKSGDKSETKQVLFRLTKEEYAVLTADAFLRGVTPTECAKAAVVDLIEGQAKSERVQRLLRERQEYEAEAKGKLVSWSQRGGASDSSR